MPIFKEEAFTLSDADNMTKLKLKKIMEMNDGYDSWRMLRKFDMSKESLQLRYSAGDTHRIINSVTEQVFYLQI